MKVKEFYEKAKSEKSKNDLIDIFAIERIGKNYTINQYINLPYDLKRYPLLNEIEILKSEVENAKTTDGINGQVHTIKIYSALIDLNEMRKAKGLKPIKES